MPANIHFVSDLPVRRLNFNETIKIFIGFVRYPLQSYRWLQFLKAHALLREAMASQPLLLAKIHRPYLSNRLRCSARLALLMAHYQCVLNAGFGQLIRRAAHAPFPLGVFAGKSGALYELQLSALEAQRQNGELVLRLLSRGVCIYTATFVIVAAGGESHVMIGALEGMLAVDRSIGIKQVTRDLYGCRPKDLMVTLVRDIGACLGCRNAILIGNRNKLADSGARVCKKSSDYDQSWKEMQACRRDDGNFELPCNCAPASPPTRCALLVNSIRRAMRARMSDRRISARYSFVAARASPSFSKPAEVAGSAAQK